MSLTLGEKLRQAREERGITLSEVADQTRISPIYLESIDNDDYSGLPGGIFNRGFVKSYAKYVGVNEQEALLDYSRLQNELEAAPQEDLRAYKPEVLTDEHTTSSMMPTVILAAVILTVMTGGILFLVNYLRRPSEPVANTPPSASPSTEPGVNTVVETIPPSVPDMASLRVEFKALNEPVSLSATSDGKASTNVVAAGSTETFEPRESLKLSYSRSLAQNVQLTINGKTIALPAVPFNPKRAVIEFEINKTNLAQIWTSGTISQEVPAVKLEPDTSPAPEASPRATPATRPTAQANTPVRPPPANTVRPQPSPTRRVIVVGNANRPG
jgi:cytoskeleton protein RodZ